MKKLFFIAVLFFSALSVKAQDSNAILTALQSGNADKVSTYFDKMLDLKFPDKDEIKSIGKNQAGIALKSFFDNNNIKGFELSSQREMGGTMYIAGKLTNGSDGYKLSMMMRTKEGRPQIITVRIS
jgi:opacity protein-like surface antigen